MMLMDEKALKQRIGKVHNTMGVRAKPTYWKEGKRAGTIRLPGLDKLPFSKQELWEHALNQVGESGIPCPYCVEGGRRKFSMIDLSNLVFDHKAPLWKDFNWELSNLHAVCADCNNEKGKLTYETFISVMQFIEELPDPRDRSNLHSCLRSHGVSGRMRGFFGKPKSVALPAPTQSTGMLALDDF